MQNMASRPRSFHDDLTDQLGFFDCEPIVRELAEYIIYNLDERGLYPHDLQDVVRDFNGRATLEQAEEALQLVQRLDPPGVGARDLRECLLLQLNPEIPGHDVLQILISQHFDDLEHNRLPVIEKKTGIPLEKIKEALEHLRRLNLRPSGAFEVDNSHYVIPDLIVEPNEQGGYEVRLADENSPQLAISRDYQKQLRNKETDQATRDYIQKKIQSARWLIESIEQRRNTLLRVARAIIEHQKDFLDKGPEFIEPLKMQQIADRVGVHVTTVSRAVDDKWVQTPRGIFPLKRFFGGGTTTADGDEIAWDTIKQKLLEIIAKEDKQNPMSDEEIVDEMARQGRQGRPPHRHQVPPESADPVQPPAQAVLTVSAGRPDPRPVTQCCLSGRGAGTLRRAANGHGRGRDCHGRPHLGDFLLDLDDRLAADQAAHRDFVAEESDVLEDRQHFAAADLLRDRQQLALFRRKVIGRLRWLDIQAVVGEIIERDTDRSGQPKRIVETRARFSLENPRDLRIAHLATAGRASARSGRSGPSASGACL